MTLKNWAWIFGAVFVAIGVLGFVPGVTRNHMLLGIFHVNTFHNWIHILSGALALYAGSVSEKASRSYFQIFGLVYALVAVLGFSVPHGYILGVLSNNVADTWLHVVIAALSLFLGFVYGTERHRPARPV